MGWRASRCAKNLYYFFFGAPGCGEQYGDEQALGLGRFLSQVIAAVANKIHNEPTILNGEAIHPRSYFCGAIVRDTRFLGQ